MDCVLAVEQGAVDIKQVCVISVPWAHFHRVVSAWERLGDWLHRISSRFTRLSSSGQSPSVSCRKIRMLGYHGLSLRSIIHLQSAARCKSRNVGMPIAAE